MVATGPHIWLKAEEIRSCKFVVAIVEEGRGGGTGPLLIRRIAASPHKHRIDRIRGEGIGGDLDRIPFSKAMLAPSLARAADARKRGASTST